MAATREELEHHLQRSHAVRRSVVRGAMLIGAVAVILLLAGAATRWWLGVALLAAIVGGSGWWITHGHIADFQKQLRGLRQRAKVG